MKTLILGGTQFLGRHITQACLDAGHEVTLFNRGQTNPDLFRNDAEIIIGDRDGGLGAIKGRTFDACIDPSGYLPRVVSDSCELLKDSVDHYTFISSISVYPEFTAGQDEDAPLAELEDPSVEEVDEHSYGGLKVLCEQAAERNLPGRVLQVRSGLIVGPHDPTDRFTYWPVRIKQGGDFVAPVNSSVPVQVIDARDQAAWIVRSIANNTTGTFNVTGPEQNLGNVIDVCIEVTGSDATPVWLPEEYLLEKEVTPWLDLPMWLTAEAQGMMQVSTARAEAVGLTCRDLKDTIRDLLEWHSGDLQNLVVGLKPEREAELLASCC